MWPSPSTLTRTGVPSVYRRRPAGGCSPVTKPVGCSAITFSSHIEPPQRSSSVVASTVVSSRMLSAIAAHWGARHVETLTGFKWLARADADLPGSTLVYAYEEAIGHCVDPAAVRDKDGISAAVLVCDLVATLKSSRRSVLDALDDLARRFGVHTGAAVSRPVSDAGEAAALMRRLRAAPPAQLAGFDCHDNRSDLADRCTDLLRRRRRHDGAGRGPAVGHRAEGQVLHRGPVRRPRSCRCVVRCDLRATQPVTVSW